MVSGSHMGLSAAPVSVIIYSKIYANLSAMFRGEMAEVSGSKAAGTVVLKVEMLHRNLKCNGAATSEPAPVKAALDTHAVTVLRDGPSGDGNAHFVKFFHKGVIA